jgi:glyoxylase I family protein
MAAMSSSCRTGASSTTWRRRTSIAGFRAGQKVNPVSHGHIAYRTQDIAGFIAHLDALGIPYSDWGDQAVKGWRQVFFYDPDGNVIEVHQVDPGAET